MKERKAVVERKTNETDIYLDLNIDGCGAHKINTGVAFLDHMLELFAKHSRFDLEIRCLGDTFVDYHHSVEDIGIALGKAFSEALSDMRGVERYGNFYLPMDETLVLSAVDLSGRAHLHYDVRIPGFKIGSFDTELVKEFFTSFVRNAKITLHINMLYGENSHHIVEAVFKSTAKALKQAVKIDIDFRDDIPSTKGVLV